MAVSTFSGRTRFLEPLDRQSRDIPSTSREFQRVADRAQVDMGVDDTVIELGEKG